MSRTRPWLEETFCALKVRNYRIYFIAQAVSLSGTWMQAIAQAWLVLQLTDSGVALGAVTAAQFLPVLVAGPWGGVIADRLDKHRLLHGTQAASGTLAVVLGVLTATDAVRLWMVFVLAFALGCISAIDNPTRQTFVSEMVGNEDLGNAVSLNSVALNAARMVGPAIGGVLIATVGISWCFFVNGASFLAVLVGLSMMDRSTLRPATPAARAKGQLREGFAYVRQTPALRTPLVMMAIVGTFAYEFQVSLPLLAKATFHAGPGGFGVMSSFMGAGAVVGGLAVASRSRPSPRNLARATGLFGLTIAGAALMPTLGLELAALLLVGAASIAFIAMATTTLQLTSPPEMRGRVMALHGVAFIGSTPVGGPIVGWLGEQFGPRQALLAGAVATVFAAAYGARSLRPAPAVEVVLPFDATGTIAGEAGIDIA